MKKNTLNEEIARLRKIMGLNEEIDLSKVDNPNAYTDDIFNYNSERGGEEMESNFDFEKAAIESASGEKVVQREFDDYDRPLYYSLADDDVHYFIGDSDDGKIIIKYNAETGERYPIGKLSDYNETEIFQEGRSEKYDDSHGSPYDRGHADSYYRRPKSPHKYPEGTYKGERITDLTPEEIEAYEAGYEDNERFGDFKDWGGED